MKARIVIWIVMLFGGAALGILLDFVWFPGLFKNIYFHLITLVPGAGLMRLVMLVSKNTGRMLAKMGKEGETLKFETNRLVKEGYYSCMRHPMHFGLLFFPLSFALIIGSVSFIILIAPLEIIIMIVMIKLFEEPEAIEKFGDEYRKYMHEVPMFNFKWSCIKMLLKEI